MTAALSRLGAPLRDRTGSVTRRDPAGRPARCTGFTLLEVVLALVILSLLALMVYGAFYVGHRAVIAGERDADLNQRMRVAEEILGRQIRATVYYFARHEEDHVPFFFGTADGMSFVTASPQSRGGTGLAAVTYRVIDGMLLLEERVGFTVDDLYDPPSDARVERAVLLQGFSRLEFEYLPREEADAEWQPGWDAREEDTLPAAVRVTVEGLSFFGGGAWIQEVPIMTVAYGWGLEDFQEPPDEDFGQDDNGDDEDLDEDGGDD